MCAAPGFTRSPGCTGREAEALALARALYAEGPQNRTPTLLALLLVLEAHENPAMDVAARAVELFGTPEKAYEALPATGGGRASDSRCSACRRPWNRWKNRWPFRRENSVLNQALPPPIDPGRFVSSISPQVSSRQLLPQRQTSPETFPCFPMRIALFGDIHANLEALEAVLEDAAKQDVTDYVCMGDIVGYNADPVRLPGENPGDGLSRPSKATTTRTRPAATRSTA